MKGFSSVFFGGFLRFSLVFCWVFLGFSVFVVFFGVVLCLALLYDFDVAAE